MESLKIYSIGHGNKTLRELLAILHTYEITCVADIRSYPYSKRNPQFNEQTLEKELAEAHISYVWFKDLGGFRKRGSGLRPPTLL